MAFGRRYTAALNPPSCRPPTAPRAPTLTPTPPEETPPPNAHRIDANLASMTTTEYSRSFDTRANLQHQPAAGTKCETGTAPAAGQEIATGSLNFQDVRSEPTAPQLRRERELTHSAAMSQPLDPDFGQMSDDDDDMLDAGLPEIATRRRSRRSRRLPRVKSKSQRRRARGPRPATPSSTPSSRRPRSRSGPSTPRPGPR